jgi:hypothetical protein
MVNVKKGPLDFILYFFLCEIFVLTCPVMARECAEICSIHAKAQLDFKLTCVRRNKCSLFCRSNKGMAPIKDRCNIIQWT